MFTGWSFIFALLAPFNCEGYAAEYLLVPGTKKPGYATKHTLSACHQVIQEIYSARPHLGKAILSADGLLAIQNFETNEAL